MIDPSDPETALARTVIEIEAHVAQSGWDAPVRVFALVHTARALGTDPELEQSLTPEALAEARVDPHALTAVEQEGLPAATDLEDLLRQLAWPETVDGVALSSEQIVLPPAAQAEAAARSDPHERLALLAAHPDREEMRLVVGVLRQGSSWCALRSRRLDTPASVVTGADLVPGLVEALRTTLS
ncbi:MAG: PPA1309 family protein [Actinomyces sp.]|uniref:PPA1309 family protein n=1 Tax=Actinomyces sp. TaxID=29317 RepID=UPI0026DAFB39|nr:PPA1309 family protein [Actinomyces sp.]MDO4244222.1 PPA1309 family protein [Actinomyces sp.]